MKNLLVKGRGGRPRVDQEGNSVSRRPHHSTLWDAIYPTHTQIIQPTCQSSPDSIHLQHKASPFFRGKGAFNDRHHTPA